ncbi:MAG: hypothetical protein ACK5HA_06735 [Planctomycetaceae bacterium]
MHVPSRLIWVALACCLALPITPVATTPVFAADVAEVREYLARAQARLAERDPVSVDNLLHLAEVALEDLPPADQQALQVEITALRKQWENDTGARRAALVEKRLEALFTEAELTLGSVQAGGRSTLKAIEQTLADPATLADLGREHLDKYRRRLALFERAHARKLAARGLMPTVEAPVETPAGAAPASPGSGAATGGVAAGGAPVATATGGAVVGSAAAGATGSTPAATPAAPGTFTTTPNPTTPNPATPSPVQSIELGRDTEDRESSRPVWQITLFGSSGSRVGLFTVLWRLLLTAGGVLVVLTKAGVRGVRSIPRVGQLCDSIELVPMPMWGLLMAAVGLWWLLNGWIVWGLLPSAAMLGLATFTVIDIAERLGWVGPTAADAVRRLAIPLAATALGIAVLHVLLRGAWIIV